MRYKHTINILLGMFAEQSSLLSCFLTSDPHCVSPDFPLWSFFLSHSFAPVSHLTNERSPSSHQSLSFSLSLVSHFFHLEDSVHLTGLSDCWDVQSVTLQRPSSLPFFLSLTHYFSSHVFSFFLISLPRLCCFSAVSFCLLWTLNRCCLINQ